MAHHHYAGSCHCGTLRVLAALPQELARYAPRACDCRYCTQHAAAYLSDPEGTLRIEVADSTAVNRYRQGSGIADFWICKRCGVLGLVSYEENDTIYATINYRILDISAESATPIAVSPQQLDDSERVARWKKLWFNRVTILAD